MPGRALFGLVAFLLAGPAAGPAGAATATDAKPSPSVENLADFDFATKTIAENYAGWETKVTPAARPALDALTAKLRAEAPMASDLDMANILDTWLRFFRDGHLGLGVSLPNGACGGRRPTYRTLPWTEASVRARLAALVSRPDPVEGIWRQGGDAGRFYFGVLRTDAAGKHFAAVVVRTPDAYWKVGQVAADIFREPDGGLTLLAHECGESREHARLVADNAVLLLDTRAYSWVRAESVVSDPDLSARVIGSSQMFLRPLSPRTLWLRIPDFQEERRRR